MMYVKNICKLPEHDLSWRCLFDFFPSLFCVNSYERLFWLELRSKSILFWWSFHSFSEVLMIQLPKLTHAKLLLLSTEMSYMK